ncbi:hypothetical protein D3C71_2236560 [compost metagenome]
MSSVALLLASQFVAAAPDSGQMISRVALPMILMMELVGAVVASVAFQRSGESTKTLRLLDRIHVPGDRNGP